MVVALAAHIVGVSCFQILYTKANVEVPFEEPIDEDSKDINDDFSDDKELPNQNHGIDGKMNAKSHYDGYLVSHANQVKEIFTPPPKF
jgi:hypothetical protein